MKKRIAAILALITALSQPSAFAVQKSNADIAENYGEYVRADEERAERIEEMHDAEVDLLAEDENVELFADGDFKYSINYYDTVTIKGYIGSDTEITIPSEINGKKVTEIGYSAFEDCESLTSITIPDSVTYIGDYAFSGCSGLESITIPDSVTYIDEGAFADCSSLESITIPDSVTYISGYAFEGCSSLESITIPDGVTYIGRGAFYDTALYNNEENWENSVLYIGNNLIEAKEDIGGEYIIKDGTVTIAQNAFYECESLSSVTISDSVKTIGWGAFLGCSSLASVTIPGSVITMGRYAFSDCSSLESITIPDSVTEIGYSVFENCESLTSITIPDSVTYISGYAFASCSSLTSITIPDSVTYIGGYAFGGCSSLESITIPNSVTHIDGDVFEGCDNLTIYGYTGSYAEEYAIDNYIPFSALPAFGDVTIEKPDVNYSGNKVTTTVSIANENGGKFTLYAVGYKDGAIVGIKSVSVTGSYDGNIEFDTDEKPAYVKVFAFDAVNGASPLCKSEKAELK